MKGWSVALRVFVLQLVAVLVATAGVGYLLWQNDARANHDEAVARSRTLATAVADDPFVRDSVTSPDPAATLAGPIERLRRDAGADFITVMAPDGTRFTHPDPEQVGGIYRGTRTPALAGKTYTETFTGTLGPSVRAIAPVRDDDGGIVALAAAGITVQRVDLATARDVPGVLALGAVVLLLGAAGSALLARYLWRTTLGRGPAQLARMHVLADATLHTAREGLLLVDGDGTVQLFNDRAAELLDLPATLSADDLPLALSDIDLPPTIRDLLVSGATVEDELHVTGTRVLHVTQRPVTAGRTSPRRLRRAPAEEKPGGRVLVLGDHTEISRLSGQLGTARSLSTALRAQTHEHANRLHTIVSLLELGRTREALDFAVADLGGTQRLTDEVITSVDEPFVSALLLGKTAAAHERGVRLDVVVTGEVGGLDIPPADLITLIGNLVDNAIDAAAGSVDATVEVDLSEIPAGLRIRVADTGPGLPGDGDAFALGTTSKAAGPEGRGVGLALVRQTVARLGGSVTAYNDGGAVFVVELPRRAGDPSGGRVAQSGASGGGAA
ncbi:ATP-binding protein [Georgenia sp. SYP-B2076]|uniref:sensor histidine kinase n=1 Tax=Georgenia sp. SYP-B2076 TaxID=2495881 RepID=UPI0013E01E09|nr:ATP-binding protein [Georgenia sp. SYP-B2076]